MDFFGQTANIFQLFEHKSELQETKMGNHMMTEYIVETFRWVK